MLCRHEDVDYIITAGIDDSAKVWAWRNEQLELRHKLEKHALGVVSVATGNNGNCEYLSNYNHEYFLINIMYPQLVIATSSLDSSIRIWDVQNGKEIRKIGAGPVDVWSVSFTPDSKYIVSGSHAGKVNWYSVETGDLFQSYDTRGKFTLSIACVSMLFIIILKIFFNFFFDLEPRWKICC